MANKNLNARIVLRNDTKANWQSVNPILMKGELGVEFDPSTTATGRKILFKIGDGVTNWNDLPYGGGDFAEVIAQLQQALPISDFSSSNTVASAISAARAAATAAQNTADSAVTAASAAQSAADAAQTTANSAVTAASHAQDAADAAQATANAASTLASANKATLDSLTAAATVEGSIDYRIAQASSALSSRIDGIQGQIGSGFDSTRTVASAITTVSNAAAAAQTTANNAASAAAAAQSTADSAVTSAATANQAIAVLNGAASVTGSVANTIDTTLNATGGVNSRISNLEAILPKDSFSSSNTVATVLNSLDARIDALEGNHFEVVSVLPATGQTNVIYLVPDEHVGYKEWIYIKTGSNPDTYSWEEIGDTNIDLSNYYTKSEVDSKDSATLASAKTYADGVGSNTLASAKTYADSVGTNTLASAKTYADGVGTTTLASANAALNSAIEGEVTRANAAYLANTDVLILDCGNASTNYSAS